MRVTAQRTQRFQAREAVDEKRFSRSSLYVVLFAVTLLLLGIGFKIYRFTLPTEGWSLSFDFDKGLMFDRNLLGVPSRFQKGDLLLSVAGESTDLMNDVFNTYRLPGRAARETYRVGNTVPYRVLRDAREVTLEVPLYHWSVAGVFKAFWQIVRGRVFQFNVFVLIELAIAAFVFYKRPSNLAAQLLLLMFVASFVSGFSAVVALITPADVLDPVARVAADLLGASINPLLGVPLFLHLALVFPKPKWGFDKRLWPAALYGLPLGLTVLRNLHLTPNFADALVPLYFLLAILAFVYSLVTSREEARAQMKWVIYGFTVFSAGSLLWVSSTILGWLPPAVGAALQWFPGDLLLTLCLAVAILRYRLFDIDFIINRTLVYGTLSLGVLGLYLGLVTGSSFLVQTRSSLFALFVTFFVVTLVFKPFWRVLNQGANRLIPVSATRPTAAGAGLVQGFPERNVADFDLPRLGKERRRKGSRDLVIGLAVTLVLLSVAQKAYRFTLPFEGWRTTTDFESDEPIFEEKLLDAPSDLQAGDRVKAVNGVAYLDLEQRAVTGKATRLEGYTAGQTVRYTVLREGENVDVDVPLYGGTSIGLSTILWQFFTSNGVGDYLLWLGVLVTLYVFWKRPNHLTAQLLFLQVVATVASAVSWTVAPLSVADTLHPFSFYTAGFFSHWIHLLLEQPLGLHIILSFPRPSRVLQNRWSLPLLYGLPAGVLALTLAGVSFFNPFVIVALYNLLGIIAAVRLFFAARGPVETAQVRWFAFGFAFANLGLVTFGLSVAGLIPNRVAGLVDAIPGNLIFLICMAIAILRYRLFDIDIILNRTLVWGGLTAGVVGLYALVVDGLGRLIPAQDDVALSLLATGLVAVVFSPLREGLQRAVNRLLYGQRDEPYKMLSDLSQQLGTTVLPASILPTMTQAIAAALKLPYVAVAVEQAGETHIVAESGTPAQAPVTLPLVYQSERIGELRLEPRTNETRFSPAELRLLQTVAQQASVSAYAVRLTSELQRSREQLVTTREEERLRIRRDLHDGLGPTLASIALKLDAARNLAYKDPAAAEALLETLKVQARAALGDIRRLVYALRPPALDELGLLGALREQIRQHEGSGIDLTFCAPEVLPPLAAAVEVAAYRIVQEALANVSHHAGARMGKVTVSLGERLELEVSDDGVGLTPGYHAGVGLHSMRERAEELGGSFAVAARPQGGTRVTAGLPLSLSERRREDD